MATGKESKEKKSFDLIDEFLQKYGAGHQNEKELLFDYKSNDYTSYLETMEADVDVVVEMRGEELIDRFLRRGTK